MANNISGIPRFNYPATGQTAANQQTRNSNDEFISAIKQTIEADPLFADPVKTANQFLRQFQTFLMQGGSPSLSIPEIGIGKGSLQNISCLELAWRIYYFDIEGLNVCWDNEGVEINQHFMGVIDLCLEKIDQRIADPNLEVEEMIALLHCIQASDPYLSHAKKTGTRMLDLIEKFLAKNGNPIFPLSNVKMGRERVSTLTILEFIYFLWKLPHETEIKKWKQEINDHFKEILNRCLIVLNQMQIRGQIGDQDLLPMIRCAVEFNEENERILSNDNLSRVNLNTGNRILQLFEYFVTHRANPNLLFSMLRIGGNVFSNISCLHVAYLLWKNPNLFWNNLIRVSSGPKRYRLVRDYSKVEKLEWEPSQEARLQRVFDSMLKDPRADLTMTFSERSLQVHHFVNAKNIAFYRQQHPKANNGEKKFYANGELEPDERVIDALHGHSLERMTLAHYATLLNDFDTLRRLLELEPRLRNMTCFMTIGKATVDNERQAIKALHGAADITALDEDDQSTGNLAIINKRPFSIDFNHHVQVVRTAGVSLLHLAARSGHEGVLSCLLGQNLNLAARDSDNRAPQDYLQLSVEEKLVADNRTMTRALRGVTGYDRVLALPEVNKLIHYEGYDLLYNTSRKVAIFARERLRKGSFGNAVRTDKWRENPAIPQLNRATDADYTHTGLDRGHLAPAEDATETARKMEATFHLDNAAPQNQNLNRGAWSRLESHVRNLTEQNDLVEVFTGPLFLPEVDGQTGEKIIRHRLIGTGDVHVPTHFFKVIFKHNRTTTHEVYILPNQPIPKGRKFSDYRFDNHILFIQQYSGIIFNEWMRR